MAALALGSAAGARPPAPAGPPCVNVVDLTPEDCGLVPVGVEVVRSVSIENTRDEPVYIRLLSKTCGCVSVSAPPEAVAPGASAVVTLSTPAAPLGGEQAHGASFAVEREVRSGERAQVCTLSIAFRYTPDLEFMVFPSDHVLLHAVAGQSREFALYVNGKQIQQRPPYNPESAVPDVEPIGVVNVPENPNVVKVLFRARPRSVGTIQGTVRIRTVSPRMPVVSLPVILIVRPAVLVDPPGRILKGADLLSGGRLEFTVAARPGVDAGNLSDLAAEADSGRVRARLERANDGAMRLVADVPAGLTRRSGSERLRILDRDGRRLAEVPLAWTAAD
jgi:hypothetical protein